MTIVKQTFKRLVKLHRSFFIKIFSDKLFSRDFISSFSFLIFPIRGLEQKTKQDGLKKQIFCIFVLKITKGFFKLIGALISLAKLIKLDIFSALNCKHFWMHVYLGVTDRRHLWPHQCSGSDQQTYRR